MSSPHTEDARQPPPEIRRAEGGNESDDADGLLAAMGYKAELVRTRSTWHVAFMSFVLASIPYGLATTLYYPLQGGGPVVVVWGWLLVSLIILCIAASLGEITSVYPTAGGVYYQTFMLAPISVRRLAAYICGWAYVVGNITITLAVQFGTTLFFVACVNVFEKEPGVGVWGAETYQVFLTFLAITLLCNAISAFGNRYLHLLDVSAASRPPLLISSVICAETLTTWNYRPLPSSGLLPACSPFSSPSSPSPRRAGVPLNLPSEGLSPRPAGRLGGPSASACSMLPTPPRPPAWSSACAKRCSIPPPRCPRPWS
jgi:hypothetical protein